MLSLLKLFLALSSIFTLVSAYPGAHDAKSLFARAASGCSTKNDDISTMFPSDINTRGGRPLLPAISAYPTFVAISIGVQNYTCQANGTYAAFGAITELYDISCLPDSTHAAFTTFISDLWRAAPPSVTAADLVAESASFAYTLGEHHFITDPTGATSGIFARWDFTARLKNESAYVVAYRTGEVTAPNDAAVNADWLSLAPVLVNGKPDGLLADQVFRLHSNGGNPPSSCVPGSAVHSEKSVLNFWFYGGAWAS